MKKLAVVFASMMVSTFVFATSQGSTASTNNLNNNNTYDNKAYDNKTDTNTLSQQQCDKNDKKCQSVNAQENVN